MQGRRAAQAAAVSRVSLRKQEGNFEELPTELASPPAPQNLKFERPDWSLFRTVEGLQQKAGVEKSKLRRLVLKELADNGLDENAKVRIGELGNDGGYFVEDDGRGIDGTPEEIAERFSIARPFRPSCCACRAGAPSEMVYAWSPGPFSPRTARSSSSPAIAGWCFGPSATARRRL